jgi:hypothetical protein
VGGLPPDQAALTLAVNTLSIMVLAITSIHSITDTITAPSSALHSVTLPDWYSFISRLRSGYGPRLTVVQTRVPAAVVAAVVHSFPRERLYHRTQQERHSPLLRNRNWNRIVERAFSKGKTN